jgi:hypothetical protein
MATLDRSNLIIAADVQLGRQMVRWSRQEDTHIGRKETENKSIELHIILT